MSETIKIFARIRPQKQSAGKGRYQLDQPEPSFQDKPQLHFKIDKDEQWGLVNNTRENYDFKFNRVFDQDTQQDELFDNVAKEVIDSVLDGYNGTIFAYGQTGSGKTFTMTGGVEKYSDRGLIPRSIQYIFDEISKKTDREYSISVSYLEIYNENGYDLLQVNRENLSLDDLPKVTLHEDGECIMIRNLGENLVKTDEDALNLLFLGDTNKMIAETPSNPASSRSHCVFTINITSREHGTSKVLRSKLNLVDLAGSERVAKTKVDGTILKEARYINLSLHFLEQVIIALHEKSIGVRTHIPYRNSMMTSILRDSLGGNCKTCMVATLAVEPALLFESISTCRFAQRVALIKNDAQINEELDLNLVIENLKREIEFLKTELALARGGEYDGSPLPDYEIEKVRKQVDNFIVGSIKELLFGDVRKITEAFRLLKQKVQEKEAVPTVIPEIPPDIKLLEQVIVQRDAEIAVLVSMLNDAQRKEVPIDPHVYDNLVTKGQQRTFDDDIQSTSIENTVEPMPSSNTQNDSAYKKKELILSKSQKLADLREFQLIYPSSLQISNHRKQLKKTQIEVKEIAQKAQSQKMELGRLKSRYEERQMKKIMLISDPDDQKPSSIEITILDNEIQKIKQETEHIRANYKENIDHLKNMKRECDHLQHLIQAEKQKMIQEFEKWLSNVKYPEFKLITSELESIDNEELVKGEEALMKHLPEPIKLSRHVSRSATPRPQSKSIKKEMSQEMMEAFGKIRDQSVQDDIRAMINLTKKS